MSECLSFLPQINDDSKFLILGSMPGIKSLEMQQYYAHPQNRFWKIMGKICNREDLYTLDYLEKIDVLLQNNIALWDVVKFCDRVGSLDSDIKNEIPNEIPKLLQKYPNIEKICLNGNKSYSSFKKYFPFLLQQYECFKMPSTSPANAKFSVDDLFEIWRNPFEITYCNK